MCALGSEIPIEDPTGDECRCSTNNLQGFHTGSRATDWRPVDSNLQNVTLQRDEECKKLLDFH